MKTPEIPIGMRKLKVAAFPNNEGFCCFYRIRFPLEALENDRLIELKIVNQSHVEELLEACAWADVIIFQYASPAYLLKKVQDLIITDKMKKVVIADFDDNMFEMHYSNPAYTWFGREEMYYTKDDGEKIWLWKDKEAIPTNPESKDFDIQRNIKASDEMTEAIMMCDAVICSTEPLAKAYSKLNENVVVLKNCIQPIVMDGMANQKEKDEHGQVVIGWQGGSSHFMDLKPIIPALHTIQEIYGDKVKFRFFGARFDMLYEGLNHDFIPWVRPNLFFYVFSKNLFDIGIIPLAKNRFNQAKSNIKWLEYSYYKIPTIAQNVTPYKESITHKKTGLLFNDNSDLVRQLRSLIDDRLLRVKLGKEAHDKVISEYNVNQCAYEWLKFFYKALEAKLKGLKIS